MKCNPGLDMEKTVDFSVMQENGCDIGKKGEVDQNQICLFPTTKDVFRPTHLSVLSKIEEVDESRIKSPPSNDENDEENTPSLHVMWKANDEIIQIDDCKRVKTRERPKSANYVSHDESKMSNSCGERKRSIKTVKSSNSRNSDSESNSESSLISILGRPKSAGSKPKEYLWHDACVWSFYSCPMSNFCNSAKGSWLPCESKSGKFETKKSRSNPNLTGSRTGSATSNADLRIERFKRSLKMLGLEVTDFGIYDNRSEVTKYGRRKMRNVQSTFSTKIIKRSISLDGLKEEVREAWLDDRLDVTHRKLLAQAAYEEWYFRKVEEEQKKLASEKMKSKIIKEKLEYEFECRKAKAQEHFRKWIEEKKKQNLRKNCDQPRLNEFAAVKTREEIETAYRSWKKQKDKLREERLKVELIERERQMDVERQKEEKKAMAEKAFIEWKRKIEETEKKMAEAKFRKEKRKKEIEIKISQGKKTSFETWKDMKDKELITKRLENRKAIRIENELRSAQLEERLYEAEQAYEDWLEQIELRECTFKSNKSVS